MRSWNIYVFLAAHGVPKGHSLLVVVIDLIGEMVSPIYNGLHISSALAHSTGPACGHRQGA